MADTLVVSGADSNTDNAGFYGPYWTNENTAIIIYINTNDDVNIRQTVNGGSTWDFFGTQFGTVRNLVCWFEKETPGDTGNLVHAAWLDAGDSELKYANINVNTGSVSSIITIATGLTISLSGASQRMGITKTVGGNLIINFITNAEQDTYKSTDGGSVWNTIADVFNPIASQFDWTLLYPANTADDNDAACIYWNGLDLFSLKMYDDSANSWTETVIDPSLNRSALYINMDASVRHSDSHIILAIHSDTDTSLDNLQTWDLTVDSISSPTITAKTNIFTAQSESAQTAVVINQQNDDIYVAYLKGGTWTSITDVVFHKSTDGMTSWGTEQAYNEAAADDNRFVTGGRTVGDNGGNIQWSWYNDDLKDLFVNLVNDINIPAVSGEGTNIQINISDVWKEVSDAKINIGDSWKVIVGAQINIGDVWKTIF